MRKRRNGAFRTAVRGAIAGAVGTAVMDLVWFTRFRRSGGKQGLAAWETSQSVHKWEDASDPGQVGRRLVEKVTGHEIGDSWARPLTNIVHWTTGLAWGVQFGLLSRRSEHHRWVLSALLGPTAWLVSYVILPLIKVYKPIWKYDARTLVKDFSAHLAYGSVTATTSAALTRPRFQATSGQ